MGSVIALLLALACHRGDADTAGPGEPPAWARAEPWRPQLHYSPPSGWQSDPNGLVRFDGAWHLFYQHSPEPTWGPMHWGHAVSADGVRWEDLPVALAPDPVLGDPWSGSAVVDRAGAMQLLFTSDGGEDGAQKQTRASSPDGLAFTVAGVVLPNPGEPDFRDPKVFPSGDGWVAALAVGARVSFYASDDLDTWTWTSDYEPPIDGIVECPDLVELDGRHVLIFSTFSGGAAGGSGAWYAVGTFDGATFAPETAPAPLDWGSDAYAWQSWAATERRVGLSWMSNWRYALLTPTEGFRGAMTLPRELSLDGDRLVQRPIPELDALEHRDAVEAPLLRVRARLGEGGELSLTNGEELRLSFAGGVLSLDRTALGDFAATFPAVHAAPVDAAEVEVDVWLDTSSVEVFADGGRVVITDLVFPSGAGWRAEARGDAELTDGRELATAWPAGPG